MPRVTFNSLSKKKSYVRKRRSSVVTRAKYQKPTARNQKSQIMGNALAIRSLRKLMPKPIYTDWQYSDTLKAIIPDASFSETLQVVQLMSPSNGAGSPFWQPVMRQDETVLEASATKVLRMQLNLRYRLAQSEWCQYSVFVVSIRPDAANRVINSAGLNKNEDYIVNSGDDFSVRLNASIFKVHYTRQVSLTKGNWVEPPIVSGGVAFTGNPQTTFAKGQVNMKLNRFIRQPTLGLKWKDMDQSQFGPTQRLFLLAFMVQRSAAANQDGARVNFDALYTCYNAS